MRNPINYCFYGLLLIFLDFNIKSQVGQIDLFSDALGIWLLAYGLYVLQRVNERLYRAFHWSLVYFLVDVGWEVSMWAGWLKFRPVLGACLTVVVTGFMLAALYEMLGGLAWEADQSGWAELADEVERWRGYMILIFLAGAVVLITPFVILQLIWGVICLILILQLAYLLRQCSKKLSCELAERPQESILWTLFPILILGLALGTIASVACNLPQTIEVPYMAIAEQETAEVTALRQQLVDLGLPMQVVNDFDAEEIQRYQGVWKVTGEADQEVKDAAATLHLQRYVCYLPDGRARYIGTYRYLELPKQAYSGIMDLTYMAHEHGRSFRLGDIHEMQSLQLFERQGKTYRTLPLLKGDQVGYAYTGQRLEFGLPRRGEAVRGYMLLDCWTDWDNVEETWLALTYYQQTQLRRGQFELQGSQCTMVPQGYEQSAWIGHEEIYDVVHPEVLND